jgi:hypothetical protein
MHVVQDAARRRRAEARKRVAEEQFLQHVGAMQQDVAKALLQRARARLLQPARALLLRRVLDVDAGGTLRVRPIERNVSYRHGASCGCRSAADMGLRRIVKVLWVKYSRSGGIRLTSFIPLMILRSLTLVSK